MFGGRLTDFAVPFPPLWSLSAIGDASWVDDSAIVIQPGSYDSPPSWLAVVVQRLQEIGALASNWDGYGAPAPAPEVLVNAFANIGALIPADAPAPSIFPTALGGVQFEWTFGTMHIEIESLPNGAIEAWGEETASGSFWEGTGDILKSQIAQALTMMRSQLVNDAGYGSSAVK